MPPPNQPAPASNALASNDPNVFYGEPDANRMQLRTEPQTTLTPARVQMSLRMRFNPIRQLTPELLSSYLEQFRIGFFRNAALAWDAIERRDATVMSVAPKRKMSVSRHGYEVLTVDDSPKAMAQKEFLEHFYDNCSATTALEPDEEGGFSLLLRQMMDSVGKRYSVHEIIWQPKPDGNLSAKFIHCPLWWFEGTIGKLRYLLNEFSVYGVDMQPGEWLITVGPGIMEACSVAYMYKNLSLRDWLSFSEKFGFPGILGKTQGALGSAEWNAMEEAVRNFASDWAAVTNSGNEIDLIEAKTTGQSPFQELVEMMDRRIVTLWRGSDLGTNSRSNGTGASLQAGESEILEVDDAMMLTETLARKVSRYALAWKFGNVTPLAYVKIKVAPQAATDMDLRIDQFLLSCGFPLSVRDAANRFSRPMPDGTDENELLTPPASPMQDNAPAAANPVDTFANAASVAQQNNQAANILAENARNSILSALNDDVSHVIERINAILSIEDEAVFRAKLKAFIDDFPKLKQSVLADPATARALAPVISSALANGMALAAKNEPKK